MGNVLKQDISIVTAADLSGSQFLGCKLDATGKAILCSVVGEFCLGVIDNKPTSGQVASVAVIGVVQAKAGGVINPGDPVKVGADGRFLAASLGTGNPLAGSTVIGRCVAQAATAANDIFDLLVTREGAIPTTAA